MSQAVQRESKANSKDGRQRLPSDPIGCYLPLLLFMLTMSAMGYFYVVTSLPMYRAIFGESVIIGLLESLLIGLHVPLAALFSWILSGILICLLLHIWFNLEFRYARAVFVVVVGSAVLWWIFGLVGRLEGVEPNPIFKRLVEVFVGPFFAVVGVPVDQLMGIVSPVSVFVLSLGILALPAIWYWRPATWSMTALLWLMLWLTLLFGMREYRVGVSLVISLVTSSGIFVLGLHLTSGYILPLPEGVCRREMLGFLRDCAQEYNFPFCVVVGELHEKDRVEERISGVRFSEFASAPGFVISDCDHAVAVSAGTKFKGVKGPGVVLTRYADQVTQIVDLRPQLRAFSIEALTKDGIKVKALAHVLFKIDSRGEQPVLGKGLPYSRSCAYKAMIAQRTEYQGLGTQLRTWDELPTLMAKPILQSIISEYDFADLYGFHRTSAESAREVVAQAFCHRLTMELSPLGIALIDGRVGNIQPADPEVYFRQIYGWQEEWVRMITRRQTEEEAERLQAIQRAKVDAQADLIVGLHRQLSESTADEAKPSLESVRYEFLAVVEELALQPAVRRLLSSNTRESLGEIHNTIIEQHTK